MYAVKCFARAAVCACLWASTASAAFDVEDCSSNNLNLSCMQENAQQQVNCLSIRINKINECNARVDAYEKQLQSLIQKKVEEKGLLIIDPLKMDKANHLEKMRELENIMKWHDSNVHATSEEFVLFTKDFADSYKKEEGQIQERFQAFWDRVLAVSDYLDFINIRFAVRSLLLQEQSRGHHFVSKSTRLIHELQAIERFVKEKLKEYDEYFDKNGLDNVVPGFTQEVEFARGVALYAQTRTGRIEDESRKIIQHIDGKLLQMQKAKLQQHKACDFKEAKFIERERSFHAQVSQLVDNALIKSDPSKFLAYEYLAARYKGIKQLLSIDSVCEAENLSKADNNWLAWGCEKYSELKEIAEERLATEIPDAIKAALSSMELERPAFEINQRIAVFESLQAGNLERAVDLYDDLLNKFAAIGGVR